MKCLLDEFDQKKWDWVRKRAKMKKKRTVDSLKSYDIHMYATFKYICNVHFAHLAINVRGTENTNVWKHLSVDAFLCTHYTVHFFIGAKRKKLWMLLAYCGIIKKTFTIHILTSHTPYVSLKKIQPFRSCIIHTHCGFLNLIKHSHCN